MGQQEVYNFLKSVRELYVSSAEIVEKTNLSIISVQRALAKLYKHNEVEFIKGEKNTKLWKLKEEAK